MVVVVVTSKLNATTAPKTIAITRRLVPIAHAATVYVIGDFLGITCILVCDFEGGEAFWPQLHERGGLVIEVFLQDAEVAALMAALANEGCLLARGGNAPLGEGVVERRHPFDADVHAL